MIYGKKAAFRKLLISAGMSLVMFGTSALAAEPSDPAQLQGENDVLTNGTAAGQNNTSEAQIVDAVPQDNSAAGGGASVPMQEVFDPATLQGESITLDESWPWAGNSMIHSGEAKLYRVPEGGGAPARKNVTVCVNAGHGTSGGSNYETLSHPDGTPKVTGGTTAEGAVYSIAVSSGMTFADGTPEPNVTLMVAMELKTLLLDNGYDVLMIRESDDVQLDNIARTVMANQYADLHVAIHFDSTNTDKGCYYCSVPDIASYRAMEPVASHWEEHTQLGQSLISGLQGVGLHLFGDGTLPMDLTQTSYSTVPSIDIELGDAVSDHSPQACALYAQGLKDGIDLFADSYLSQTAAPAATENS